jgi:hypothetical protein
MIYSKKNLSMINILRMFFLLVISSAEAAPYCSSSAPQCCWVVRMWQTWRWKVGYSAVSPNNPTGCCFMKGVECGPNGTITKIDWNRQQLRGMITQDIEYLKDLKVL